MPHETRDVEAAARLLEQTNGSFLHFEAPHDSMPQKKVLPCLSQNPLGCRRKAGLGLQLCCALQYLLVTDCIHLKLKRKGEFLKLFMRQRILAARFAKPQQTHQICGDLHA